MRLRPLSRPSDQPTWLQTWLRSVSLRHFLLGACLLGALFLATWARILPATVTLKVGDLADRNIVAPRTVTYVDSERTERLRAVAEQSVPRRYVSDPQATQTALQALEDFFDQARQIQDDPALDSISDRVEALQARIEFRVSEDTLRQAVGAPPGTLTRLRDGAIRLLQTGMSRSITANEPAEMEAARRAILESSQHLGFNEPSTVMVIELAQAVLRPNLVYDPTATQAERERAAAAVKPVTATVRAGEVVISRAEVVTQRHLDIFRALGLMSPEVDYPQALALFTLLALVVILLFYFTAKTYPGIYRQFRRMLLICAVLALNALIFRLGATSGLLEAYGLTTVTAASLLVALIAAEHLGLVVAGATALLLGLISPDFHLQPVACVFLAGVVASYSITRRTSRTETLIRAALGMALFNVFVLGVTGQAFSREISWQLLAASGVGSALAVVLALGLMWALDRPLGLLTDLRLAELASPHQPLLHRLVREAPGTYQSSVMVANLAEQAAESIGANSLLVRTAALYHDVGKLKRPYFFVENQFSADNPHDKLSPYMSAMIIATHPRDGAEMALEAGLPRQIVDIIEQHQGSDLIRYFYEKAVEAAPTGTEVPQSSFRYPGPKPRSREAALLMLADAAEAATRALDNPTPERVEQTVARLIKHRIDDGQLDEAPLTFAELTRVREALVSSINSAFHHRIKYPEQIPEEARLLAERLAEQPGQSGILEDLRKELDGGGG